MTGIKIIENNIQIITQCHCISVILTIFIKNNSLICDMRMKWMKDGEAKRFLSFNHGFSSPPTCVNFPDTSWNDVTIPESEG